MKQEKPSPTAIRDSQQDFVMTETTVWKGGKSRTFSAQEVSRGDADKWVAEK